MSTIERNTSSTPPLVSILSGSVAGIATDIILFPLDTIKTRVQSEPGLWRSGGLRNVFRGVASAALGSAPSGASFFFAYDFSKQHFSHLVSSPVQCHMVSACIGESFSCLFRIPFEVVKQQAQASADMNSQAAFLNVIRTKGVRGLYQGYFSMVNREIPFSLIQLPIWEFLKSYISKRNNCAPCTPFQSAMCGSVAGGIAAAITTPLDVAKTRIILTQDVNRLETNPYRVILAITGNEGIVTLFSGIFPRVTWISIGGFIFFGTYEKAKEVLHLYSF